MREYSLPFVYQLGPELRGVRREGERKQEGDKMHLVSFIALFINFILAFPGPSISGFHTGFFSWGGGGTPRASASKIFGLATPTFTETTPTFTETTPTLTVLWLVKPVYPSLKSTHY